MDTPAPLLEKITQLEPPAIIAVSGFGGAGKSSFASSLGFKIGAPVVGLDAFIIDHTLAQYAYWEIMDFGRLEYEVLRVFLGRGSVRYGQFEWGKNSVVDHCEPPASEIIIVEGVGLFRPNLLKYFSLLIWVDCPLHEASRRGKQRDRKDYNNPQDEAWDGIWKENDEQCFKEYRPREAAHFVVDNSLTQTDNPDAP